MDVGRKEALEARLAPLRVELWSTPDPPFASLGAAAEWIEAEHARGDTPARRAGLERMKALMRDITARLNAEDRQQWAVGATLSVGIGLERVVYSPEQGGASHARYATTPTLVRLAVKARELAEHLSCTEHGATAAIMTGVYPPGVKSTRRLHAGAFGATERVSRHVGAAAGRITSGEARPLPEAPALRPVDLLLLAAVRDLAYEGHSMPPAGRQGQTRGVADYWQRVTSLVNERLGALDAKHWTEPYKHWTGPQRRYRTLVTRYGPDVAVFW